jgi:predicted esterase
MGTQNSQDGAAVTLEKSGAAMKPSSFNELHAEMGRLRDAGHESGALDLVTRSEPLFPQQAALTRMLRVELLAKMNRASDAVDLLRDGLDRGFRYRGRWLRHERLAALTSQPDFSALVERSEAQYERAQADARPDLSVFLPHGGSDTQLPVLVALHGNNRTMQDTAPSWQSVVRDGWVLAVPQSSEIATTPGFFVWNDRDRVAQDLKTHLASLRARLSLDATRSVLGGFSMGARLAIELGLTGRFLTKRILAIGTWLPDFDTLVVLLERSIVQESRVYVVVGRHDASGYEGSMRLVDHLTMLGGSAQIEIHDGGHEEPSDMPATLMRALAYLDSSTG